MGNPDPTTGPLLDPPRASFEHFLSKIRVQIDQDVLENCTFCCDAFAHSKIDASGIFGRAPKGPKGWSFLGLAPKGLPTGWYFFGWARNGRSLAPKVPNVCLF